MRSFMFATSLAVLGVALVPPARGEDGPDGLIGGYTVVSGERSGQAEPKDRIEGTIVRIAKDGIAVTSKDKKEVYAATYTIDAGRKPWRITMTSKLAPGEGEVARGLIEKDGDTVRLIYALPGAPEPTEFKTRDRQLLFILKNENK